MHILPSSAPTPSPGSDLFGKAVVHQIALPAGHLGLQQSSNPFQKASQWQSVSNH